MNERTVATSTIDSIAYIGYTIYASTSDSFQATVSPNVVVTILRETANNIISRYNVNSTTEFWYRFCQKGNYYIYSYFISEMD